MTEKKCDGSGQYGRIEWEREGDGAWVSQCGVCDAEVLIGDDGAIVKHDAKEG
jgi:hypothetical protein